MNAWRRLSLTLPTLSLFVLLSALLGLAELAPKRFEQIMQEDGWAEWATFCAFSMAGVLALRMGLKERRARLERVVLLGLGLFCVFVAGEEISWGQRLLGFRPPNLFLERNYQQESNLHNLFKDVFDTRWMVFSIAVGYGVLAPFIAYVIGLPRYLAARLSLLPWFACVAWLEFSYPYELVGELAELLLGLSLLADVIERTSLKGAEFVERMRVRGGALQVAAVVLGFVLVPLNDLALRGRDEERIAHTADELALLASRVEHENMLRTKLFEKRDVHKRLYTAVKAGYLELDPREFYLDPWNSPYWLAFARTDRDNGTLLIYSLGPNRRRDLDPRTRAPTGTNSDDLLIELQVSAPLRSAR